MRNVGTLVGKCMILSERILFKIAKRFYKSDISQPTEARKSFVNEVDFAKKRSNESARILSAASKYGIDITNKSVLDFGCNDGAITVEYTDAGAGEVIGVDINPSAIVKAKNQYNRPKLSFLQSDPKLIPTEDNKFDVVFSYDVFEHVSNVSEALQELYRVIKPGGQALIGVCGGWHHPFAPHLRAVMPVPWAHVLFSEKTVLSVCRMVYKSDWYTPQHYDLDTAGVKLQNRYEGDTISKEYLNKYLLKDFRRVLENSKFDFKIHLVPFGYKFANLLIAIPWFRELFTGYAWLVLSKPTEPQP
jgi:SAM-dependent methyltransferase